MSKSVCVSVFAYSASKIELNITTRTQEYIELILKELSHDKSIIIN